MLFLYLVYLSFRHTNNLRYLFIFDPVSQLNLFSILFVKLILHVLRSFSPEIVKPCQITINKFKIAKYNNVN